jgi:hypothetical protein
MLSEQETDESLVKVISEVGFTYSNPVQAKYKFFISIDGSVREEHNASRAISSKTANVKHRTYEISESEKKIFFDIINRDFNTIYADGETLIKKRMEYKYFTYNCKTYVMNIFKEMGVFDAKELSNFFIQRPNTTDSLLKPLSSKELICPQKEELINKIRLVLTHLINEIILDGDGKKIDPLTESIEKILAYSKTNSVFVNIIWIFIIETF